MSRFRAVPGWYKCRCCRRWTIWPHAYSPPEYLYGTVLWAYPKGNT